MTPPMPAQDLPRGWQAGAERGPCRQIADYQAKPLSNPKIFPGCYLMNCGVHFGVIPRGNFIDLHSTHLTHSTPDQRQEGLAGYDLASGSSSASS
jgi:hypothetical protein